MKNIALLLSMSIFLSTFAYCADAPFYASGPSSRKAVALTFDDGPGKRTAEFLDVLKANGIKATFFMEGSLVEFYPKVVEQVKNEGHEIGSHLYNHPDFYHYKKPDYEEILEKEMNLSEQAFIKIGVKPVLLRMPHGYVKKWVKKKAGERNYTLINWSFGCDWGKQNSQEMAASYIKAIRPGAIFLMHDGGSKRDRTLFALKALIKELKEKGYEIVTVSDLLGLK